MNKTKKSSLKKETIKGFFWMFSGSSIQAILQFVVLIVLVRLLDPVSFGIASAALVVISFTVILSTLGLGPALVQKKEINKLHIGTSYVVSFFLALVFGIIIYLTSPIFADFFRIKELDIVLKVMSIVFIMQGVSIVSESLIQREMLFDLMVRIQVISYLAYAATGVILAFKDFGFWALIFAYMIQIFIKSILSIYYQPYKIIINFDLKSFKDLLYFSGGYSIAKVSSELSSQGDNFIVGRYLGSDALGLYSRAYQLMVMPANLIGQVLEKVLFPAMSKIQNNNEKITYIYTEGIRITTTLMFPISIFLAINAESIILLLFGKQWLGLLEPFQILALSLLFRSSYKISDSLAKAKGAVYHRAIIKWFYAIMVLSCSYIGHRYGLKGVSIGVSIAIVLNYILMTRLAIKLTNTKTSVIINSHFGGIIIASVFWLSSTLLKQTILFSTENYILELFFFIIVFLTISLILILMSPKIYIGKEGEKFVRKHIKYK